MPEVRDLPVPLKKRKSKTDLTLRGGRNSHLQWGNCKEQTKTLQKKVNETVEI